MTPWATRNARDNAVKLRFIVWDLAKRVGKDATKEREKLLLAIRTDAEGESDGH